MLGPGSVLHVGLPVDPGSAEVGEELIEVEQLLDLSAASGAARVRLQLSGGFAVYDPLRLLDFRLTLIRYGALRMDPSVGLGELFEIDCTILTGGRPDRVESAAWMLLNAHGHGTSGSIQLVSRPLGERLLRAFPSVYSA